MSHPFHMWDICGMYDAVLILVRSQSLRLKWVSCQHWHLPSGLASNPWRWYQNSEWDIIRYIKQNWRKISTVRCQTQENFPTADCQSIGSTCHPCLANTFKNLVSLGALRDTDCDSDEDSLSSFESDDEDEDDDDDEEDDDVEWEMGTSHVLILAQRRVLNVERDTSNHVTFQ